MRRYLKYQRGTGKINNYMKYQRGDGLRTLLSPTGIAGLRRIRPVSAFRRRRRKGQRGKGF